MVIVSRNELRMRIRRFYRLLTQDRQYAVRKIRKLCRYFLKTRKRRGQRWATQSDISQWLAANLSVSIASEEVMLCLRQLEESKRILRSGDRYSYR